MKYKIEYLIMMIFIKIIKIFPENFRFKFAEFLGLICYKFVKKRRLIALANLKLAFPNKTFEEREKIALSSFKIMFKAFISTLWFDSYLKGNKNVTVENMNIIDTAMSKGHGAIIACMHMGNMEASLKVADKYHVITVSKSQRNPYVDKYITEGREKLNITLLKKSKKTGSEIINSLKRNNVIALFSDHRDKGATVNFFGTETIAPTGAVSLALKHKVPLIWGYNILNDDNTCIARVIEEISLIDTGHFKDDLNKNMQILINKMESAIRNHPEQWMWFHDRWSLYKKIKNDPEKFCY